MFILFYYMSSYACKISSSLSHTDSRFLNLYYHWSLLSIIPGRSSRLHPVSTQSWWMEDFVGHPTQAHPCIGVLKRISIMNSCLLRQQCPHMSYSSYLDGLSDGRQMAIQLLFCGVNVIVISYFCVWSSNTEVSLMTNVQLSPNIDGFNFFFLFPNQYFRSSMNHLHWPQAWLYRFRKWTWLIHCIWDHFMLYKRS